MAYKQELCPLCGRNMTAIETYPGRGELYCGHCDLTIGGNDAKTPDDLIELMDSSEHRRLKAENAKLHELVRSVLVLQHDTVYKWLDATTAEICGKSFTEQARELGIEVD